MTPENLNVSCGNVLWARCCSFPFTLTLLSCFRLVADSDTVQCYHHPLCQMGLHLLSLTHSFSFFKFSSFLLSFATCTLYRNSSDILLFIELAPCQTTEQTTRFFCTMFSCPRPRERACHLCCYPSPLLVEWDLHAAPLSKLFVMRATLAHDLQRSKRFTISASRNPL